jgi:hypothetical protein
MPESRTISIFLYGLEQSHWPKSYDLGRRAVLWRGSLHMRIQGKGRFNIRPLKASARWGGLDLADSATTNKDVLAGIVNEAGTILSGWISWMGWSGEG